MDENDLGAKQIHGHGSRDVPLAHWHVDSGPHVSAPRQEKIFQPFKSIFSHPTQGLGFLNSHNELSEKVIQPFKSIFSHPTPQ